MIILTIVVFLLILGVLILIHELFHLISAKRSHVKVEEFCIGFPPRIFKKKVGETTYSIGIIPFGGFNKIYGEDSREKKPGSFFEKSIGTRAKIIAAGVMGNFFLAAILFSIIFGVGTPQAVEDKIPEGAQDVGIQVIEVGKNSPAELAGIKLGDKIVELKTKDKKQKIKEIEDVQGFTQGHLGEEITLTLKRGNKVFEKKIIPRENPPEGEGPMGVALLKTARIAYPWYEAILKGVKNTFLLTGAIVNAFFQIIKGAIIGETIEGVEIAGPIGIGNLVSQMIDLGWIYVLQFTAILSINLAIINILPFPALDGGRLIFLLIEKIKKTPVKIEIENLINQIGFVLLIILMIIITFRDIQRFF